MPSDGSRRLKLTSVCFRKCEILLQRFSLVLTIKYWATPQLFTGDVFASGYVMNYLLLALILCLSVFPLTSNAVQFYQYCLLSRICL